MKIYDMHIHGKNTPQDPKALVAAWEKAYLSGVKFYETLGVIEK